MSSIIKGLQSETMSESPERVSELQTAVNQAMQLAKSIKYDNIATDIIVKIQALAEKYKIDPKFVEYAIDDVMQVRNKLESAVFGLVTPFKDALDDEQNRDEVEEGKHRPKALFTNKPTKVDPETGERTEYDPFAYQAKGKEKGEEWSVRDTVSKANVKAVQKAKRDERRFKTGTGFYSNYLGNRPFREEVEEGVKEGYSAGLGIEKSPMEKIIEKPLDTVDEHIGSPGGMGQSYRKFTPKSSGLEESDDSIEYFVDFNEWEKQANHIYPDANVKYTPTKVMYISTNGNIFAKWEKDPVTKSSHGYINKRGYDLVAEDASRLHIGDPVYITGNVQFQGERGYIKSFGERNAFVIVHLLNYGDYSFHSSDVSFYDEDEDMYEGIAEEQAPMFTPEDKMVNVNNPTGTGWRFYKTKESSIMKGLQDYE